MPETPNYKFALIPDRFRGWGAFYRSAMTTIDATLKQLMDRPFVSGVDDVPGLRAILDAHQSGLDTLGGNVAALTARLAASEQLNANQTERIATLEGQVSAFELRLHQLETAGGGSGTGSNGSAGGGTANFPLQIQIQPTDRFSANPYTTSGTATTNSSAGSITDIAWSWSGGNANGANASINFGAAGTYLVTCKATDSAGNHATAQTTIVIPPAATLQTVTLQPRDGTAATWKIYGVPIDNDVPGSNSSEIASTAAAFDWTGLPAGARFVDANVQGMMTAAGNGPNGNGSVYYPNGDSYYFLHIAASGSLIGQASTKGTPGAFVAGDQGVVGADLTLGTAGIPVYVSINPEGVARSGKSAGVTYSLRGASLTIHYLN